MAHFARINENNIVEEILVVSNEHEHRGQEYLANDLGLGGRWIQTSYNANFRGKFAGIGDTYDEVQDLFIEAPIVPTRRGYLDTETKEWVWIDPE